MDKKFLNRVVEQIISETRIDYRGGGKIFTPFLSHPSLIFLIICDTIIRSHFTKHCRDVYGLNKEEIEYVWNEYKHIIKDKVNNGL